MKLRHIAAATFVFAATSVSCMESARADSYVVPDYANDGYVINHDDGTRSVVTPDYAKGQDAWVIRHSDGSRTPASTRRPSRTIDDWLLMEYIRRGQ